MRLLSNLRVKSKPAVLPDRAIRRQSHYFIYRPCITETPLVGQHGSEVVRGNVPYDVLCMKKLAPVKPENGLSTFLPSHPL